MRNRAFLIFAGELACGSNWLECSNELKTGKTREKRSKYPVPIFSLNVWPFAIAKLVREIYQGKAKISICQLHLFSVLWEDHLIAR